MNFGAATAWLAEEIASVDGQLAKAGTFDGAERRPPPDPAVIEYLDILKTAAIAVEVVSSDPGLLLRAHKIEKGRGA